MRKFLLYSVAFLLLVSFNAMAQDRTISGKVLSSEDDTGLPGVNVLLKGTSTGAITDVDGNYRIVVPSTGGTLVFSFIGFTTIEEEIGSRNTIDITMSPDVAQLSEVVVVGYGSKTKEALTGSINTIDSKQLETIPVASFKDALQGIAGGVQVLAQDGTPGAAVSIRIRGIGSINASNEPLYVVDGIPVTSGSLSETDFGNFGRSTDVLNSINPNDIANITVLKDAASTAIYGARASNGVILITTKSGSAGAAKIDFKTQYGWSEIAFDNLLEGLNESQYRERFLENYVNAGSRTLAEATALYAQQFPEAAAGGVDNIWLESIQQQGTTAQYDLSFQGGTENFKYFVSGGYFDQDGIVINNKFERYSTRVNLSANVTDKLQFTNNLNLTFFDQRGITDGTRWQAPFYLAYLMAPSVPIFDDQGRFYGNHSSFFMGGNNPVGHLIEDERELKQSRIINNLSASYEIMENLTFKSAWSFDIINVDEHIFSNGRYGDGRNVGGTVNDAATDLTNWLGTQTLTYGKTFNDVHNFDALLGYEAQKVTEINLEATAEGFSHPTLKNMASAANPTGASNQTSEYAFNSYFLRTNYDYDGTYYLSASIRRDGSSRFGPSERWGTFWSVGGGYTLSNAGFMQGISAINFLKLRASYGVVGNANGFGNFAWAGLYAFNVEYDGVGGALWNQTRNENLTWESAENTNIGLDLTAFNNRLNFSFEYFTRESTDLILDRPLSGTTGFRDITENVGDMKNSGTEWNLSGTVVQSGDLKVDLSANITFLKNEITKLPSSILDGTKRREEGRDFQEYYLFGWAGVDDTNGDPLWYTNSTESATTNDITQAERYYQGKSATPDFYGSFSLNATYKGVTLSTQFNYQFGSYVYDGPGWVIHGDGRFTPRSTSTYAHNNRWTQPGQNATFPQQRWGGNQSSNTQNSSRYLFDGDFIRMRTVNVSYNLPTTLIDPTGLRAVQVYVRLNNFWTWVADDNLHFDPEQTINGFYNTVTPISKTVSLGLNIGL